MSIGAFTAAALALAGDEALKATVGEAVKDAYKALKDCLTRWAGGDVDALEKNPSAGRQAVVAETIDGLDDADKAEVLALAQQLKAALQAEPMIGLEVTGRLEAMNVEIGDITVREGTGARFSDVSARGDFKTGNIAVGPTGSKKN